MVDLRITSLCLLLGALSLSGQQVGDPSRDYTINGLGSGQPSPFAHQLLLPNGFQQNYATTDPSAPVIWATHPALCTGHIATATNSLDVCIDAQLELLLNGSNPTTLLDLLARTNGVGDFALSINLPVSIGNLHAVLVMAHLAASSPDAFWVSQAHELDFVPDGNLGPATPGCASGAAYDITPLLGSCSGTLNADDGSAVIALQTANPFKFYGSSYTEVYVCSNGFVTFGSCDTDLSESVLELLNGPPRIAAHWDDLNPAIGGQVSFYSDNASHVEVCWQNVPEFGSLGTNSFKLSLDTSVHSIILDFQSIVALDGLVGISPGMGIDSTGRALDLSLGNTALNPSEAVYEFFAPGLNAYDLNGFQLRYFLDTNGQPVLLL